MGQIVVSNINKSYGKTDILKGINFSIGHAEQVAIKGASGSGKSTLLYLLGGLDKVDSGEIQVADSSLSKLSDEQLAVYRNQSVGFVFQFHFLLPSMNCLDNILLPARIGSKKVNELKKDIDDLAQLLGVTHCLSKFPFEISGGEQQRVNIIRALCMKPDIMLCDEPTGNLDSQNSKIVIDLLKKLSAQYGSTLIVVTHDEAVADSFQRKITIEDGRIIS